MFNPERLLGSVLQQALTGGMGRGYRSNNSRRHTYRHDLSTQLGMTLLGVAVAAVEHYFKDSPNSSPAGPSMPPPTSTPPPPPQVAPQVSQQGFAGSVNETIDPLVLVRTMIAAAAADGVIDDQERARILGDSAVHGLSLEETRYLEDLLKSPPTVASLTADIVSRAAATQMYLAALLTVDVDSLAEESFLRSLAEGLGLSADETKTLRAQASGR